MQQRLIAAAVSAAMTVCAFAAHAEQAPGSAVTGTALLEACDAQDGPHDYCLGFIGGIADVVRTGGRRAPVIACIPPSVTRDQIVGVTIEYLHDHPREVRSYAGAVLVLEAIRKAFRCG
jgi:hypothetical protein